MKRQDINLIKEKLSVLIDQPLQDISRGGGSIFISFGELIEKDVWNRDEDGNKINERKVLTGKYALHIECCSRFVCEDKVVLGKFDLYEPKSDNWGNEDFDWDNFDWDIKGNNRYDELAEKYFSEDSPKFIAKNISVNKIGDLKISLTNDFVLEIFADASDDSEYWRFFESGNKDQEHLVVTGQGIGQG